MCVCGQPQAPGRWPRGRIAQGLHFRLDAETGPGAAPGRPASSCHCTLRPGNGAGRGPTLNEPTGAKQGGYILVEYVCMSCVTPGTSAVLRALRVVLKRSSASWQVWSAGAITQLLQQNAPVNEEGGCRSCIAGCSSPGSCSLCCFTHEWHTSWA